MNSVLVATLAGLTTMICWGSSDWLVARMSKKSDKFEINFGFQIPSVLIMLPILIFADLPLPTTAQILKLGLVAVLFTTAFLLMIKALATGSVGIVIPLANTYALVTLVLSSIFIGGNFSGAQIAAILSIIAGAALLAYEKNYHGVPLQVLHKETFLALSAAATWGLAFYVVNTMVNDVPWQMMTGVTSTFMLGLAFILLVVTNKSDLWGRVKHTAKSKKLFFAGTIGQIGAIALYVGSSRAGSVVIPAVLASGAPLMSSLLSAVYDKEKIGVVKRVGAMIVIAGIIILNVL